MDWHTITRYLNWDYAPVLIFFALCAALFIGTIVAGVRSGGYPADTQAPTVVAKLIREGHEEALRYFMLGGYKPNDLRMVSPYAYDLFEQTGLFPVTTATKLAIEAAL